MRKIWFKNLLMIFSLISISSIATFTLTNCSSSSSDSSDNESNVKPDPDPDPSPNPPIDPTPPSPPIVSGSPYASNQYALATPNPNFQNDPLNSFLVSEYGPPSGSGESSPGIEKNSKPSENYLYTQTDVNNVLRTYSFGVDNGGSLIGGTAWILDYKIPDSIQTETPNCYDDNNYPTTWYFGTNTHVLHHLWIPNDELYPHRDSEINTNVNKQSERISLRNPIPEANDPEIGYKYGDSWSWYTYNLPIYSNDDQTHQNPKAKRIFLGNDFLKTNPSDFNQSENFKKYQEYADFAVMEYTFDSSENAKKVTRNYANKDQNLKFKYKKTDLIHSMNELPDGTLYQLGFPSQTSTSFNPTTLCLNRPQNDDSNKGATLSTSPYYNNVDNHPGILDNAIGLASWLTTYQFENNKEDTYLVWGLNYATNYGSMRGGSSGSLVTDKDGYAWSVHYASDEISVTGLSQAFYSKGYDYQGKWGNYNLPGYDLISGYVSDPNEFPLQKASYRDNLIKLYGSNQTPYRTNIFPNGVNR